VRGLSIVFSILFILLAINGLRGCIGLRRLKKQAQPDVADAFD